MAEKKIIGRAIQKHDIEANWLKATNFIPMQGEIIIYDIDENYTYERLKIGDGVQNVNVLPFVNDALRETILEQINSVNDKVNAISDLVGDEKVSDQITTAIENKADLVDGKIPTSQLPSTFSGQEITIVAKDRIQIGSVVYVVSGGEIGPSPVNQLSEFDDSVYAVSFSPDGKLVLIGGWFEGYAKVYSVSGTTLTYVDTLKANHSGEELDDRATTFHFSPDGSTLYVQGDFTGYAKIYSVSGTTVTYVRDIYRDNAQTEFESMYNAVSMALSKDGTRMAIGVNMAGSYNLYSVDGTNVTYLATIETHDGKDTADNEPTHLAFSPDGTMLVAVCRAFTKVYTVSGNNANFLREFTDPTLTSDPKYYGSRMCAFSPDGKLFAICGFGTVLARVYSVSGTAFDLIANVPLNDTLKYDDYSLTEINFSSDSKYMLLCGTYPGGARIYDVSNNSVSLVTNLTFGTSSWDLAYCGKFSPDGSMVIVGGDAEVRCKVYGSGQEVVSALKNEYVADYSVAIAQETIEAGESGKVMIVASVKSPDVSGQIAVHNTSDTAHSDIRAAISAVSTLVGDTSVSEQISTSITSILPKMTTITLQAANWMGDANPWSQVVTMNGVTVNSKVDLQPTAVQIVAMQNADIAMIAENNNGVITVYAIGSKPTSDYTMQVLITEVVTV